MDKATAKLVVFARRYELGKSDRRKRQVKLVEKQK